MVLLKIWIGVLHSFFVENIYNSNCNINSLLAINIFKFSSFQSLSRVQLFVTPWTTALQVSLSITNSQSLLNSCPLSWWCHPTISSCHPLLLLPSIFPSTRVFSNGSALAIRWPKYWGFSFSISPSNEHPGLMVTAAMKLKDALWKKSYDQPRQHIKKQRHYLSTRICLVNATVFPVVMYGCESWTIKKVEHQRIDAFELWCWRRLLRVPWTTRSSNHSILKDISPEYSLEGLMLRLKLQYFGHLMQRFDSLEKPLMLGKIEGRRRRRWQRMRWLDGITDSMDMSLSNLL